MPTKEEILAKHANIQLYTNDTRLNFWIGLAMDEFAEQKAKEVAIGFAEFLKDNRYTKTEEGWYQRRLVRKDFPAGYSTTTPVYNYFTIEQIFDLYLQSKQ